MKKLVKYFVLATISISALNSCKDDFSNALNNSISSKNEILLPNTAKVFENQSFRATSESQVETEEFAQLLALSLKDKDFRKFIKDEASKKFDGDFDILVSNVKNSKIGNELFSDRVKKNSSGGYTKGQDVFEKATLNAKLNISIPVLIEKWDDSKQKPLVAVAIGANEKTTTHLKAFDSNGKAYLIDAKVEPNVPVLIISNNERLNLKKDNLERQTANLRTSGNYEKVTWLKCPNLSEIEGWFNGAPEIRFDGVVYNDNFSAAFSAFSNMEYPPSRGHAKDGYTLASWTSDQNLFQWHFDANHGSDYFIQTFEIDDDGTTQSVTISVSSGTNAGGNTSSQGANYNLTYRAQDKKLKGELIHYTHQNVSNIGDSSIEFTLEN